MPAPEKIPRIAKGRKPQYFTDPATDKLLWMVLSLAGELSVTRERLDALERLLESQTLLDRQTLDEFHPDDDQSRVEREQLRQNLVDRLLSVVRAELQETADDSLPRSREEIIKALSEP